MFSGILALAATATLAACGPKASSWQTYEETYIAAPARNQPAAMTPAPSKPRSLPRWTAPEGWQEERGTGMRLATFNIQTGETSATGTIISLSGAAGGLEANVKRWIGQLKLETPPPEAWAAFLEKQQRIKSEGGYEGVVVDLTELAGQEPDSSSMLAALVTVEDATLFIKLTGPLAFLRTQKEALARLCQSIQPGGP